MITVAALASSFPDYSGLEPLVTAVVVAAGVGIVYAFVRVSRRTPRQERDNGERVPGVGRRVLYALLAWLALCGVAWLLVTAFS